MMRLGLLGYPVEHSLSPRLHRAALDASGIHGEYSLYPIHPADMLALGERVNCVRTGELNGLNVTIPHKQNVLRFLDGLTPRARAIGAVNTIYFRGGMVLGDNTDSAGFLADLKHYGPLPRSAIVLGAGGAARAVVHALRQAGCQATLAARRMEQARELAAQFAGTHLIELNSEALLGKDADLIVNTTPVGMAPHADASPWPAGLPLPTDAMIYDLIYNPRDTLLVRQARAAGLRATTGLGMLIEQAVLAFELWTGCTVSRDVMFDALKVPNT